MTGPGHCRTVNPILALLAIGLSFATLGCGQASTASPLLSASTGQAGIQVAHRFKLSFGGLDRTYLVYQPTSLSRTLAAPLVIVLHGYNGSGAGIEETAGFDAQADGGGFLVVYPDGYSSSWNTGDLIGEAGTVGVDDVGS